MYVFIGIVNAIPPHERVGRIEAYYVDSLMAARKRQKPQKTSPVPATTKLNLIALKPIKKVEETQPESSQQGVELPTSVQPLASVESAVAGNFRRFPLRNLHITEQFSHSKGSSDRNFKPMETR